MYTHKDMLKPLVYAWGFYCIFLCLINVVLKQKACLYHDATFAPFCASVDDLFGIQASHFIQKLAVKIETLLQCSFLLN